MGYAVGYDSNWDRDIGYGVPAVCDYPECDERIDRGLGFVCGGEPYGGDAGCGLFFCSNHLFYDNDSKENWEEVCERCLEGSPPFEAKPDTEEWVAWKMTDPSWSEWRKEQGLE